MKITLGLTPHHRAFMKLKQKNASLKLPSPENLSFLLETVLIHGMLLFSVDISPSCLRPGFLFINL